MLDLLGKGKNMPAVVSSLGEKCLLLLTRKANFNFILPHIRERVSVEHTFSGKHFGANLKDTSKSKSTVFSPSTCLRTYAIFLFQKDKWQCGVRRVQDKCHSSDDPNHPYCASSSCKNPGTL